MACKQARRACAAFTHSHIVAGAKHEKLKKKELNQNVNPVFNFSSSIQFGSFTAGLLLQVAATLCFLTLFSAVFILFINIILTLQPRYFILEFIF